MSILESIQKAPWDRESELEQLRAIAKEQHEALMRAKTLVEITIGLLDSSQAEPGSTADMIEKALEKYEAMQK